jgi:putative ABC transport system substrate-binding protein
VTRVGVLISIAITFVLTSIVANAQQPPQVPVVGVLMVFWGPDDYFLPSVRKGLNGFGYVDGRNIRIEYRSAQGQLDRLPRLARELTELGARVIVVGTAPAARAVAQVSDTVPVVFSLYDVDPVASGLIESFSRPGRNMTGICTRQSELVGKRLELLKEVLPQVSRVSVLWDASSQRQLTELESSARALGIQLERVELRPPYDFPAAFRTAKEKRSGAVVVLFSPAFIQLRTKVASTALESKLPTIYQDNVEVEAGGFMSYGPSSFKVLQRTGYYIDRLLKGEKASELPVEQATDFRLVVNLKTAKALSITIPESILQRADEVIR